MMNRSILYQLQKYQTKKEDTKQVTVPETPPSPDDIEIRNIADTLNTEIINTRSTDGDVYSLLVSMPRHANAGILYPKITLARYHLAYNFQLISNENFTSSEIMQFLSEVQDKEGYRSSFVAACDLQTKRLICIRLLLATYNYSKVPLDNLSSKHRIIICNALGVPHSITLRDAANLQESSHKSASIEQLILSRLGYMVVWNALKRDTAEGHSLVGQFKCRQITSLPPGQANDGTKLD